MRYPNLRRHADLFSDYTELRVQENSYARVSVLNGDVVGNAAGSQSGISARAYRDGVWGFSSSPEDSDGAIRAAVARATENARFLASREGRKDAAALPSRPGSCDRDLSAAAGARPAVERKELIDFARALESYCDKRYPGLVSRSVSVSGLDMEKTLVCSDGADAYSLVPRSLVAVSLTADAGGEPLDLYEVWGGLGGFTANFSAPEVLYPELDLLMERLRQKCAGVHAKPGQAEVVLAPDLAGILAHEAVGHTVEADFVQGGSVASDYLGRQVASPLVTLVDFAHEALGLTCPVPVWVDDEGTLARDAVLIEGGTLKGYMHNKESAAHFSAEPTGNARAYGFSDEPLIRMRNTAILPGSSSLEDMIASVDDGYYFLRSSNGQADSTGEFMFGVVMGYEIKGGKLGRALRDCTISGVAFDMLKTVSMLGKDMAWTSAGMCGKKQSIPVGMGGPAIRCRITVGGRA